MSKKHPEASGGKKQRAIGNRQRKNGTLNFKDFFATEPARPMPFGRGHGEHGRDGKFIRNFLIRQIIVRITNQAYYFPKYFFDFAKLLSVNAFRNASRSSFSRLVRPSGFNNNVSLFIDPGMTFSGSL